MSCNHSDNFILESRVCTYICMKDKSQVKAHSKRRRRVCKTCGYRWTTYELEEEFLADFCRPCLLYTSPSPRDGLLSRMPSSA